jgi:RNA polymerase sigma-70 factor (ECF subfamily)
MSLSVISLLLVNGSGEGQDELDAAVRAARAGDEDAFRALYTGVHAGLLRYVRVLVGDDAEDVASEAWLQIIRDLHRFTGGFADFRGWAVTVARNRALDHLRRIRRRPVYALPVDDIPEQRPAPDAADVALDRIGTSEAVAMIGSLPPDQAVAVMLRVVLGLDAVTAAKILGKRPGAVRMATHRGLTRLAQRLRPTVDQPSRNGGEHGE